MEKDQILVVDDEESLCEILQFNLEAEGYEVDVAYSAEQALQMKLEKYSLILLDIMMGAISGLKMAQLMKKNPKTEHIPIIFITAKDAEDDTVIGLNVGADDYIAKPFSIREVMARVKSVLRRVKTNAEKTEPTILAFETLTVDMDKKCCMLDGQELKLTKTELELLTLLLENRGRIFTREEILKRIWSDEVVVLDRTIDVNITRLRKKVGRYGEYIVTRLGYGYGFDV
jgi:two-component system phosphate regulon response regulator PhoB